VGLRKPLSVHAAVGFTPPYIHKDFKWINYIISQDYVFSILRNYRAIIPSMDKLALQSLISKISIATDEEYHLTKSDKLAILSAFHKCEKWLIALQNEGVISVSEQELEYLRDLADNVEGDISGKWSLDKPEYLAILITLQDYLNDIPCN